MQIARNALALGDLRQVLDLFVGLAQLPVHAVALGEERVSRADDHGKQRGEEKRPAIEVQQQSFDRADAPMLNKPITAAVFVWTQNGSMAAAKMKNVQAPG